MTENAISTPAIVIERTLDASTELVWQMWTEPEHFKSWYGPQGFSIPVAEIDLQVGGRRLICMEMQSPDGGMKMWTTGEHRDIVPNTRLVYTESMSDENGNIIPPSAMGMPEGHPDTTEVTIVLEDLGGKTRMTMTHAGVAPDSPGASGWNQALDKLVDYVAIV
jgi:uncharacterized protein YndB with AHSA1/START domain